ncbi:hypothetical protein C8Q70DRAFT_609209 [Cubamyces menziesii]|nr:hypothetical protein C8Q70DRAFT_609209 [Cubamyces menziesii]
MVSLSLLLSLSAFYFPTPRADAIPLPYPYPYSLSPSLPPGSSLRLVSVPVVLARRRMHITSRIPALDPHDPALCPSRLRPRTVPPVCSEPFTRTLLVHPTLPIFSRSRHRVYTPNTQFTSSPAFPFTLRPLSRPRPCPSPSLSLSRSYITLVNRPRAAALAAAVYCLCPILISFSSTFDPFTLFFSFTRVCFVLFGDRAVCHIAFAAITFFFRELRGGLGRL